MLTILGTQARAVLDGTLKSVTGSIADMEG